MARVKLGKFEKFPPEVSKQILVGDIFNNVFNYCKYIETLLYNTWNRVSYNGTLCINQGKSSKSISLQDGNFTPYRCCIGYDDETGETSPSLRVKILCSDVNGKWVLLWYRIHMTLSEDLTEEDIENTPDSDYRTLYNCDLEYYPEAEKFTAKEEVEFINNTLDIMDLLGERLPEDFYYQKVYFDFPLKTFKTLRKRRSFSTSLNEETRARVIGSPINVVVLQGSEIHTGHNVVEATESVIDDYYDTTLFDRWE